MPVDSFLQVAELLPEPMLLVSAADGTILAANRCTEKFLLDPGALPGRALSDLVAEEPAEVAGYLRSCARSRQLVLGALTILRDGERVACRTEGAAFRVRSAAGPALILLRLLPKEAAVFRFIVLNQRIDALNREIARRKKAEEDLHQQREWLRVTLESIGDAVIATDPQGAVVFLNPTAESLTAWPQHEAIGQPLETVFRIVNEETRQPVANPIVRVLREGIIVGLANHTLLLTRDGRELPIDDSAAPIRDGEGEILGAVLVFHDIAERRTLEQEIFERAERLAEAGRRKDEFLAMLAHELRNPLAPIRNALQILRAPEASPAVVERAREMMERQIHHMVRLVDDLLDVSRITRGKVQLQKETVDLAALAARAAESLRPLMESQGIELSVSLPSGPLLLDADPVRLEQVLFNLLHNGAKFTPAGGRVWLSGSLEGREAVLRVRDTGIGVPADLLPIIFEPFTQADHSLDRSRGGLGIGLTLVQGLMALHGGTVEARSEGPGLGSEFVLRLPLQEIPVGGEDRGEPAPQASGSLRVLVVDDNEDAAETVAVLLSLWGYEVRIAWDGFSALDAAAEFDPEAILLDIGLPRLDGYEVARRLRERGTGALLVAMTGYGREEDRRRSREAGFDEHLVKPVDPAVLRDVLARR
ncbi:MAG TPA: ATP-binding protein [Thermoanaerobaculia bacterium]